MWERHLLTMQDLKRSLSLLAGHGEVLLATLVLGFLATADDYGQMIRLRGKFPPLLQTPFSFKSYANISKFLQSDYGSNGRLGRNTTSRQCLRFGLKSARYRSGSSQAYDSALYEGGR